MPPIRDVYFSNNKACRGWSDTWTVVLIVALHDILVVIWTEVVLTSWFHLFSMFGLSVGKRGGLISAGVCFSNPVLVTDIKLCYKKISDCVFFILCLLLPLNWIAFNLDWVSHYLLKSIHMKDANIFSVCSYSCCIVLELNMRVSLNTI